MRKTIFIGLVILLCFVGTSIYGNEVYTIKERLKREYINLHDTISVPELLTSITKDGAWDNIHYQDREHATWSPREHLLNIQKLAYAYENPSFSMYHDPKLLNSVVIGLQYWYSNRFVSDNWWHNTIGKQHILGRIALVLEDSLPIDILSKITNDLATEVGEFTGQNLLWIAEEMIWRGVLSNDIALLKKGVDEIQAIVIISDKEGIMPDFSFQQHGPQLYQGGDGYGKPFLKSSIMWSSCFRGLSYEYPKEKIEIIANYILNSSRWMIRYDTWDFQTAGRTLVRRGSLDCKDIVHSLYLFSEVDVANKQEYTKLIRHIEGDAQHSITGNRVFTWSDYIVHRREHYFLSLRLNSCRTIRTEHGNGENEKGFYLSDGGMNLSLTGDEYASIFPCWNWSKIPGTTTCLKEVPPSYKAWGEFGISDFTGGLSDGKDGIAVYHMMVDSIDTRKAWFMFDKEIVCMVSEISNETQNKLVTTLNQTLRRGDVWLQLSDNSTITIKSDTLLNIRAYKVWHDGIGYAVSSSRSFNLVCEKRHADWNEIVNNTVSIPTQANIFELTKIHDSEPKAFSYTLVPGIEKKEFVDYDTNSIQILKNSKTMQAVYHKKHNTYSIAFYEPHKLDIGEGRFIEVDSPCLLKLDIKKGILYISDPTQNLDSIHVNIRFRESKINKNVYFPKAPNQGTTCEININ